jgi:hypothetical protein
MLEKRLRWEAPEFNCRIAVEVMEDTCWACKRPVKQVFGHFTNLGEDSYQDNWIERYFTVAQMSVAKGRVVYATSTSTVLYDPVTGRVSRIPVDDKVLEVVPSL